MGPQEVIGDQAAGDDAAQDDEPVAHDAGIAGGFAASHGRPGLQRGPRRLVTAAGSADSGKNHTARQLWSAANPSSPAVFSMTVSDRQSVVYGKSASVRVDIGVSRI